MKKKFLILAVLSGICCLSAMSPVFAEETWKESICRDSNVDAKYKKEIGCNNTKEAPGVAVGIINAVIGGIGIIAVLMIVIGGINYATSSGDPSKAKKAKDTILYSAIGLMIVLSAFALVNFVLAGAF